MELQGFSISSTFREAWKIYKSRWVFLSAIFLFSLLLPLIPQLLQMMLPENATFSRLLIGLIHLFLMVVATMGFLAITIKVARQEESSWSDFFQVVPLFPSFLWGQILFYLSIIGGLLLLIIPGIVWGIKFSLWPYFVLDRHYSGFESLKASGRVVYGVKWDIFMLWIATCLLNLLGGLLLGVGLLVTVPVTLISWALVYLQLSGKVPLITDLAQKE